MAVSNSRGEPLYPPVETLDRFTVTWNCSHGFFEMAIKLYSPAVLGIRVWVRLFERLSIRSYIFDRYITRIGGR